MNGLFRSWNNNDVHENNEDNDSIMRTIGQIFIWKFLEYTGGVLALVLRLVPLFIQFSSK
jgi:hypothetical protein